MGHLSRFGFLVWASCVLASAATEGAKSVAAKLPLRFEENQGQFGKPVRYAARSGGAALFLTSGGASFTTGTQRVDLRLVHANASPKIEALDRMEARTNYIVGDRSQWHTGIANYARVRYHGVYPGVDVVYYGNQGQLEYDFELSAGVNPDAIRMEFQGAETLGLTAEGDLAIYAGGTRTVQKKPVIFQDGRRIDGHYTLLSRNEAGLALGAFDAARPLVIDPVLQYAAYWGSSLADQITAMKARPNGLMYMVGSTNSYENATTDGTYQDHIVGLVDAFLMILDTNTYTLKYLTYLGGSNNDIATALDVDASGIAAITGTTASTDFPVTGPAVLNSGAASTVDAFVTRIDPSQSGTDAFIYSTYLGGTDGLESPSAITVDKNGYMYVIGTTRSTDFPTTGNAYATVKWGPQDAFITVLDPVNPALVYSTYLGGESEDDGRGIAVGTDGKIYYAVSTNSTQFPIEGPAYRTQLQGLVDIVVGMIDITQSGPQSMPYSTYFGGSDLEEVRSIALDANNQVILTGYTFSQDFPVTDNAIRRTPAGNGDVFVSIVNPNTPAAFVQYSTYFGGTQGDVAYSVKPDGKGNLYLTGYTLSQNLGKGDVPQPAYGKGINMFVAEIRPGVAGNAGIIFFTYLGKTATYVGNSIDIGADGTIYAAGYGQSGLPSANGYFGGTSDGYMIVMK
jgi:hypothetical protein